MENISPDYESLKRRSVLLNDVDLEATDHIVVVGPNGSGKTTKARALQPVGDRLEVINALRNTAVNQQLPFQSATDANANYQSIKEGSAGTPYAIANDFDYMLATILAEKNNISSKYLDEAREDPNTPIPARSSAEKIQQIWSQFFPGRQLSFPDNRPTVTNTNTPDGSSIEYSGVSMSDGEKAALYLAGRVFTARAQSVLLVDEPETHFHSLLAIQFWDALEAARPDIRFIYVTHDIQFASSRRNATYLIADPEAGLMKKDVTSIPDDIVGLIIGTATLSFRAKRVVFCEGEETSFDKRFYEAWFKSSDTIVRPVGSSDSVFKCVKALNTTGIVSNLKATGIIDRDFHPQSYFDNSPKKYSRSESMK
jgi:energy-coupling factor transporter ATP-binding protein EcfA2